MKMAFKFHDHDHDHDHDFPDLVVVQGAVVCDDLAGEECHADDEQQERVQRGARDKQTWSTNKGFVVVVSDLKIHQI